MRQYEGVFIEEETYAAIDMSWAVDRVDQVSRTLDNQSYAPCECGNGVDVYVLDTGKKAYMQTTIILYRQVFAMIIVSLEEEQNIQIITMYLVEEPSIQVMIQLITTTTPI